MIQNYPTHAGGVALKLSQVSMRNQLNVKFSYEVE